MIITAYMPRVRLAYMLAALPLAGCLTGVDTGGEYAPPNDAWDGDCGAIPRGPAEVYDVPGAIASEDLAFDGDGNLVGSNDRSVFKTRLGEQPRLFVPSLTFRAGLRYVPSGDLMVNANETGELIRIDATGRQHPVLAGLEYPNGMEVDRAGYVYITEQAAGRVRRVDPMTGAFSIVSEGEIENPNGIAFDEGYRALYIAGYSGEGTIYRLPIDDEGRPGALERWATGVGTGWLDGLAVDACGNVYVADFQASEIIRIDRVSKQSEVVVEGRRLAYLPNMQWGSGLGGWSEQTLFVADGADRRVYAAEVGVPGKPRAYP